jgi:hypothetical protein
MGIPAFIAACLAGFCPPLAVNTWPIITSSTSSLLNLDFFKTYLITSDPSWSALKFFKEPPYVPIGVLAALTITISVNLLFINFKIVLWIKYTKI